MRTLRRCPRRSARRSSSYSPHQTPASWAVSSAHWRHSSRTGQSAQIALADCTWASAGPVVPTGKNNSGSTSRQRARWRQSIDILTFRCKPWGKGKSGVSLGQESGLGKNQILARAVETPSFAAHAQGWLHRLCTLSQPYETPGRQRPCAVGANDIMRMADISRENYAPAGGATTSRADRRHPNVTLVRSPTYSPSSWNGRGMSEDSVKPSTSWS